MKRILPALFALVIATSASAAPFQNGGFEVVPYDEQETGPGLVLIEGGTFTMGRNDQDITQEWDNIPNNVLTNLINSMKDRCELVIEKEESLFNIIFKYVNYFNHYCKY